MHRRRSRKIGEVAAVLKSAVGLLQCVKKFALSSVDGFSQKEEVEKKTFLKPDLRFLFSPLPPENQDRRRDPNLSIESCAYLPCVR